MISGRAEIVFLGSGSKQNASIQSARIPGHSLILQISSCYVLSLLLRNIYSTPPSSPHTTVVTTVVHCISIMHDEPQFNWLRFVIPDEKTDGIKKEIAEATSSLLSPPITPSKPTVSATSSPSSFHSGSTSSLAGIKRLRPYPSYHEEALNIMSTTTPVYGTWPNSGMRGGTRTHSHQPAERRSSDGDEHNPYTLSHPFMNVSRHSLIYLTI